LAILRAQHQHWRWHQLCVDVGACMFEHLVSIINKLQLFIFHNTSAVLLDFQPKSDPN
jgi:hypothetical protein